MTSEGKRRPATRTAPTLDSVQIGDTTIEYEVRRSIRRKKTVLTRVDRSGVTVVAPKRMGKDRIQTIVRKNASWILNQMSIASEIEEPQFVSGESLPYLGRPTPLVVQAADVDSPQVRLDRGRLRVAAPVSLDDGARTEAIRTAVVDWYRARAADDLSEMVERWWPRLGQGEKSKILIRNQRHTWASCSYDGTLRFNWRVIMLDPSTIEYIVVHELAHLTHRNHSKDFWALVLETIPDAKDRRRHLREEGRSLPL